MLRLFLTLVSFLAVSFTGLWYELFADPSLDEVAFENKALLLPRESIEAPRVEPQPSESSAAPDTVEAVKLPETQAVATVPPPDQPAVTSAPASGPQTGFSVRSRLLRFGYRVPTATRTIDTIVLHSSYNALGGDPYSVDRTMEEYEQYGVGAHYFIDRSGTVSRLVEESNIAYHAGSSKMPDGRKNVNDFSIGIELIATEESGYTDKQYSAVNNLIADIRTRHKIKSVVGHGDIAPGRKTDPWKFDWKKLK